MWDVYRENTEYVGTVDGRRNGSLSAPEQHRDNIYTQAHIMAVTDWNSAMCTDVDGTTYYLRRAQQPELELGL
jgi:hypothetical protein